MLTDVEAIAVEIPQDRDGRAAADSETRSSLGGLRRQDDGAVGAGLPSEVTDAVVAEVTAWRA